MDLVGPLPPSHGFTYLLTCVDRSTRWPETFPFAGISARECALFHGWISRFRVSAIITSDRGAQFTSSLWSAICSLLDIIPNKTTAFHPQANGLVERFHRQLKNSLRACLAASDWCSHLPWVLLGLCTAPREDSASSSAEAAYGSDLILPHQFLQSQDPPSNQFYEKLKNSMSGFRPVPACNNTPVMDVLLEEFHRILLLWSQLILKGDPASASTVIFPRRNKVIKNKLTPVIIGD